MQIDNNNVMADASYNLVQAAGTYVSNSVDLLALNSSPGTTTDFLGGSTASGSDPGKSLLKLLVEVLTTFTSGGAATLQVNLISADDALLTSNITVLESTAVIAKATLVQGYRFLLGARLPVGITQRYLGLQFIIGTAAVTAGAVFGALVLDEQTA